MVSEEEIILMTKLAIYDKKYGAKDKKANERYYKDYIYVNNFYTRLLALMGCLIIISLYAIIVIFNDDFNFLIYNFRYLGVIAAGFIAITMLLYTAIGTKIHSDNYKNIKKRLRVYFRLLKELEDLKHKRLFNDNEQFDDIRPYSLKEELKTYHGPTTTDKREHY